MTDLIDLRAKITRRTAAALEAEHMATGQDKSEIVRQVLDAWASSKEHYCSLMLRAYASEGLEARFSGQAGKGRA